MPGTDQVKVAQYGTRKLSQGRSRYALDKMVATTNATQDTVAVAKLVAIIIRHIGQSEYRDGNEAMRSGKHMLIKIFNVEPLQHQTSRIDLTLQRIVEASEGLAPGL